MEPRLSFTLPFHHEHSSFLSNLLAFGRKKRRASTTSWGSLSTGQGYEAFLVIHPKYGDPYVVSILEDLSFSKSWRGFYFHCSLSVCVCVCVSDVFLWIKFQLNGWTDLDAVFAKWLLIAMAQILLKLVTFGQRSRSQWRNTHFSS